MSAPPRCHGARISSAAMQLVRELARGKQARSSRRAVIHSLAGLVRYIIDVIMGLLERIYIYIYYTMGMGIYI